MKKILIIITLIISLSITSCGNTNTTNNSKQLESINNIVENNVSLSKLNSIRKAKSYLNMSGFSKKGLIKQLEFEGFSNEDSNYAVNNINVNWNKQAERKAKAYIDMSGFSKKGLIKQLEFEGFSNEEAKYGVTAIGL